MPQPSVYIFDHADFCRRCRGTGTERSESSTGKTLIEDCYDCGGTGWRAVRITETPEKVAQ